MNVGILTTVKDNNSLSQAAALKTAFAAQNLSVVIVGEVLVTGVDQTYSAADASSFDGIVVASGAEGLFTGNGSSTYFPRGRPSQVLLDGWRWGKPVGGLGETFFLPFFLFLSMIGLWV